MRHDAFIEHVALRVAKDLRRSFLNGLYLGYACGLLTAWGIYQLVLT
jgi:hypothetical protein